MPCNVRARDSGLCQEAPIVSPTQPRFSTDYDTDTDILYVRWSDERSTQGTELRCSVIVRLNDASEPVGFTLLDASMFPVVDPVADLRNQISDVVASVMSQYDRKAESARLTAQNAKAPTTARRTAVASMAAGRRKAAARRRKSRR